MPEVVSVYPNQTHTKGLWWGISDASLVSFQLHPYLDDVYANGNERVALANQYGVNARSTNTGNLMRVRYPVLELPPTAANPTVNFNMVYGVENPTWASGTNNYARTLAVSVHKCDATWTSTGVVTSTSVNIAHQVEGGIGNGALTTVALSFSYDPNAVGADDYQRLELRVQAGSTYAGTDAGTTHFTQGVWLARAELRFTYEPLTVPVDIGDVDFSVGLGSVGVAPKDWHRPDLRYRALANSHVMRRHPMMSASAGSIFAYSLVDGEIHRVRAYRDYLYLLPAALGPFMYYWGPTVYVSSAMFKPQPPGYIGADVTWTVLETTEEAFRAQLTAGTVTIGAWSGAETYRVDHNVVAPSFRVLTDNTDMSAYLHEFGNDSITFVGPPSLTEFLNDVNLKLQVYAGQTPILAGHVVRADSTPYTNVRRLTLGITPESRYYDVDLSDVDLTDTDTPSSELTYMRDILRASGFRNELHLSTRAKVRSLGFWTLSPPVGPGFTPEEKEQVYWNPDLGSTLGIVTSVANASMLEVFDLPNGDLYLDPIVPLPDYTLKQLLTTALPQLGGSAETAVVRVYCHDSNGRYVADPKLDVTSISLSFDEGFAEIEVEAYSNIVTANRKRESATFVQGVEGSQVATPYFDATLPAFTRDSNTVGSNNVFHSTQQPWKFRVMDAGSAKDQLAPLKWFQDEGIDPGPSLIKDTLRDNWGIGSRRISTRAMLVGALNTLGYTTEQMDAARGDYGLGSNSEHVVYGFTAGATGSWFSGATWRFVVDTMKIDTATLRIEPNVGNFKPEFAPLWLPNVQDLLERAREVKPRKARRVQNAYITQLSDMFAVQVPASIENLETSLGKPYYNAYESAAAHHLASWLTVKEVLRTREVTLRYAGAHTWVPNSFLSIARRPDAGVGGDVVWYDVMLVLEAPRVTGRVNGEVWSSVRCGYIGAYNVTTDATDFDMPLSWGSVWDRRGETGVS